MHLHYLILDSLQKVRKVHLKEEWHSRVGKEEREIVRVTHNMQQRVASQNLQAALDNYESPMVNGPMCRQMKIAI